MSIEDTEITRSPDAFRTISQASEEIGVPPHVLRFWEGKFTNLRPLKRAGGRRFYRAADMAILRGLKALLQDDGYTIRGVQKLIKASGIAAVRNRALNVTNNLSAADSDLNAQEFDFVENATENDGDDFSENQNLPISSKKKIDDDGIAQLQSLINRLMQTQKILDAALEN